MSQPTLRDRVMGCWMGKNCGGTLGTPLEKAYSEIEPFDVSFYPQVQPGGMPNDDLELQLIWLKALEEVGLDIKARNLADYWLNYVGYNFDEFGLMKANLRLGLLPPVSGYYNNFFKHSMGCPIRTEIWACIAPGNPRLAARYAYEDSICDHGGGESINGSLFNVAVEASAFVVHDRLKLIDIGLSYLPESSLTARCIRAAVGAYHSGKDWLEARRDVLSIGYNINAQYSPPNIAFQVIGWLYGEDFGDSLCKAVNCGYDTDCTAATLGSILGIIGGGASLPERWTAPLGDGIATSESTGGLRHVSGPPNPIPATIQELTDRVLRIQQQVSAKDGPPCTGEEFLFADAAIHEMTRQPATRVKYTLSPKVEMTIDYGVSPQIEAGEIKTLTLALNHRHFDVDRAVVTARVPEGWEIVPPAVDLSVKGGSGGPVEFALRAPERSRLCNCTDISFEAALVGRPGGTSARLAVVAAPVYLSSRATLSGEAKDVGSLLEMPFEQEMVRGEATDPTSRPGTWETCYADGNDVAGCLPDFDLGVAYLRRFLRCPQTGSVWLHVNSTLPCKVWVNQQESFSSAMIRHLRPAAWGTVEGGLHGEVPVVAGWNEFLFKVVAPVGSAPWQCHILLSDHKDHFRLLTEPEWARLPWD